MPNASEGGEVPGNVVRRGRLRYDSDNELHVQIGSDEEATVYTAHGNRYRVLCGATLPGSGLELDGMRLETEHQRGRICDVCLTRLKERESTIAGFMADGEVVQSVE